MGDTNRITNQVSYRNLDKTASVSAQEKIFCDLILKGARNIDAVFEAGYYPMDQKSDPVIHNRASVKAATLLRKRGIRTYLNKNRRIIRVDNDGCDRRALKMHIYDIAMGNITQNVMTKDGEQVQVPPSFKDQIAAAALFTKIDSEERMIKISQADVTPQAVTEEIGSKVTKFISKFNTREIVTSNSAIAKMLDRQERGVEDVDASYTEVEDKLDKALDSFLEKETRID